MKKNVLEFVRYMQHCGTSVYPWLVKYIGIEKETESGKPDWNIKKIFEKTSKENKFCLLIIYPKNRG